MERSKRTRGAIVSPNHSAFVGIGGMEEESEGVEEEDEGDTGKIYRETQRQQSSNLILCERRAAGRHKGNGSFKTCPSHHPCPCQAWQRGDRRSAQRPSLSFFRRPTACQRKLWALAGSCRYQEDASSHACLLFVKSTVSVYASCMWDWLGAICREAEAMIGHCCWKIKGEWPSRDRWAGGTPVM